VKWDEELNEEMQNEFKKWLKGLSSISKVYFPRWAFHSSDPGANVTFHVFCDASKSAYAAVLYARTEYDSEVIVTLIAAKARVAPVSPVTVPRLELLAACTGARLAVSSLNSLRMEEREITYWCDSSTVLFWIQKNCPWAPFVENRVKEIRSLSKVDSWRHVPGDQNPADLPSRGCDLSTLIKANWWNGPNWLRKNSSEWPMSHLTYQEGEIRKEIRKTAVLKTPLSETGIRSVISNVIYDVKVEPFYVPKTSKFNTVIGAFAWLNRFINYVRRPERERKGGSLTPEERKNAEKTVLRISQRDSFNGIDDLRLRTMNARLTDDGLIRMQSKILQRDDVYSFRYPVVLLGENPVTRLLIIKTHERLGHSNVTAMLSYLREKYWIIHGRKVARSVVKKCVICIRQSAKPLEVPQAPLPADRVRDARVFEVTGIDYAGPVYLFELVTSLTTDKFMEAFRRFVARRGRPSSVHSDNGTNFEGCSNLLKGVDWDKISELCHVQKIQWSFNPPGAPWWGGWWERLIQILKRILRKILGKASLGYEEMSTVLCDCESIVNARPLTYLSEDPKDLSPITPNMFLQEIHEIGVPDYDLMDREKFKGRFKYTAPKR